MKTFIITDEEMEKIQEWDHCKDKYSGAVGGHLTYSFTPTSICVFSEVKCNLCGEKLSLTNFDTI